MASSHPTARPACSSGGSPPRVSSSRRSLAGAGLLALCTLVAACGADGGDRVPAAMSQQDAAAPEPTGQDGAAGTDAGEDATTVDGDGDGAQSPDVDDASDAAGDPAPSVTVTAAPVSADALAGVLSTEIPQSGDGLLSVVPGATSAPGPGRVRTLRVAVEGGLAVDGQAFATFVLGTLNDPRSWARDGYAFARTDGEADTEVVLASPGTSEQLCRPLRTMGTLSCRNGNRVVLTWYRWVSGHEDFGGDLTLYRQYLVNHEVGHSLGHGHQGCPGAGALAPVMMQQTKGVRPCLPNAWPHP